MGTKDDLDDSGLPEMTTDLGDYKDAADFCRTFYDHAAKTERLFLRPDGGLTYIAAGGPRPVTTHGELLGIAQHIVDFRRRGEYRGQGRPEVLTSQLVSLLFNSPAKGRLPLLRAVVFEPVVLPKEGGGYEVLDSRGYDQTHKIYYRTDLFERIPVGEGTEHLERCFSGVPFQSDGYRANLFAFLLGALLFDDQTTSPLLAVTGNDRGVGKSSLTKAVGVILTGREPRSIQWRGTEFEKQLGAQFAQNARFISLDNVATGGRAYSNDRLAALVTDGPEKAVRQLGASREISQKGVLFALNMNDGRLDPDLSTRSLSVLLHKDEPGPMTPVYCLDYAREHRKEIYGELLSLALSPAESAPSPEGYEELRFRRWLEFVRPRIEPRFGPLAIAEGAELDGRLQDLFSWSEEQREVDFAASDLRSAVASNPDAMPELWGYLSSVKRPQQQSSKLGTFLKQAQGKSYTDPYSRRVITLRQVQPSEKHTSARYRFERRELESPEGRELTGATSAPAAG